MARRVSRNIATNGRIPIQESTISIGDGSCKVVVSNGKAAPPPNSTTATYVTRNYIKMHKLSSSGGGNANAGDANGKADDGGGDDDGDRDHSKLLAIGPSHAQVQSALQRIGAKPLRDYVETLQLVRKRQDDEDRIDQRREQQRRKGIPTVEVPQPPPAGQAGAGPRQSKSNSTADPIIADTDRLLQLPIMPSSRLGRTLSRSSSGHIREVFTIHHGKSYVAQLNELLQAIGCELPTYDTSSQFQSRFKTSPDFFATVVFHTFCFVDNQGKRSIKAGRECVAQMALEYFMPWCAVDQAPRYLSGGVGFVSDGEKFSELD